MIETHQIHPLTDFLRNHRAHLDRIRETHTPEVLTVNGKAEAVLLDAETFDALMRRIERIETLEAIREGIAAAERGEMKPAEQVLEEMRARYGA